MMLLTGQVAQAKIIYRLRIVCVCHARHASKAKRAGLRLNKLLFIASNRDQRLIHSNNLEMFQE
jgi:hypothetical protein